MVKVRGRAALLQVHIAGARGDDVIVRRRFVLWEQGVAVGGCVAPS